MPVRLCNVTVMGTQVPNRHSKGTPGAGQFAAGEKPATLDSDVLTLGEHCDGLDPVADLYDKMTYDDAGWDGHGYNRRGFNKKDLHRNGTDYSEDGHNRNGFNKDRVHRNGTEYDNEGFDWLGIQRHRLGC